MPTPAGWYTDPSGRHELRYWDGSRWTNDVRGQAQSVSNAPDTTDRPAEATSRPADVTIAAADATVAAGLEAGDPDRPLTRAERQAAMHGAPRGKRRWLIIGAILAVLVAGGVVAALSMSGDDTSVKTPQTTTSKPHTSTTHPSSTTSASTTTTTPGATTTTPGATTTLASKTSATTPASSAAVLPPQVVTTGTWCTTTGATGVNSKGTPMVCSATAKDGTPYPQPTWRPA